MACPKVSSVSGAAALGGAPHWLARSSCLLYVDVAGREVRRLRPADKPGETALKLDKQVSFVVPVEGHEHQYVIGQEREVSLLTWDGHSTRPDALEVLATADTGNGLGTRLSDGKADPRGRLWTGTRDGLRSFADYAPREGAVYSLRGGGGGGGGRELRRHLDRVAASSGLEWTADGSTFFHVDTPTRRVDAYDFDVEEGEISNRRVAFDFEANKVKGFPDGMTIDAEGKLWVACFGGSQVVRVDTETGALLKALPIPWRDVTSVTFGGERLQELYVTTSSAGLRAGERNAFPGAGTAFRVTDLGITGLPARGAAL